MGDAVYMTATISCDWSVGQSVVSIFEILERTYYITVHTRILLPC